MTGTSSNIIEPELISPAAVEQALTAAGFKFPFKLHQYQLESISDGLQWIVGRGFGPLFRHKVGEGKTAIAVGLGLFLSVNHGVEQILALMPPSLIDQFAEFIESVEGVGAPLVYRGSPPQRKAMDLTKAPVVIMSYNIFRSDFDRIQKWSKTTKLFLIGDELSLKAMSQTYKKFKTLVYGKLRLQLLDEPLHHFCALNATPVSDREQVYNWCSIFNHPSYPSKRLFEAAHVLTRDHWDKPTAWTNIEMMDDNFNAFSVWTENANIELPPASYIEIPYTLSPAHLKLYNQVAEAEMDKLPDNIVELAVEALFATLQRVVLVPREFGLDIDSPILEIIGQRLDQMDEDDRMIIYTRHIMVSEMLVKAYPKAVAVFGQVKDKRDNLRAFKAGEAEVMIANIDSLSKGANMQIANHTLFAELPFRSDTMLQCCGRTHRQGQTKHCFFHIPVARGTIQRQIYRRLLDNDADLLGFNRSKGKLRDFIKTS